MQKGVTNKFWDIQEPDPRQVMTLMQRYGLDDLIARILANKHMLLDEVEYFLDPKLKTSMPDPYVLVDMEKAVTRTIHAILNSEVITIYADYDVDGATSSALLRRYLRDIGVQSHLYIPDRIEEGYGANSQALLKIKEDGANLVLMMDCGTTAFEPLQTAHDAGLDVIVLDHHTAEPLLPPVVALVNPNRLDQENLPREEMKYLCAAAVVYFFMAALNRALRISGYFEQNNITEPNLLNYLDLVALGTVCDVMPLVGLNRTFVKQGLKVMERRANIGLVQLSDIIKIGEKATTYHLGFALGPRINAGGRVGKASLGSQLLTTEDWLLAKEIALQLNTYNLERQEIEKYVLEQALLQIEEKKLNQYPILLVGGEGWHPGVIGIVASRLKERFSKPACVVGFDNDIGKGSGRSVTGVTMGEAMIKATNLGLLEKGGGHAMAAGFTVLKSKFDKFYAYLNEELGEKALASIPSISVAAALSLSAIKPDLVDMLETLEPFGAGNPQPKFLIKKIRIQYMESMSDGLHKRCRVVDEFGQTAKLMAFRVQGTPLEEALNLGRHKDFDAVVTLKKDSYSGNKAVTIILEDLAF